MLGSILSIEGILRTVTLVLTAHLLINQLLFKLSHDTFITETLHESFLAPLIALNHECWPVRLGNSIGPTGYNPKDVKKISNHDISFQKKRGRHNPLPLGYQTPSTRRLVKRSWAFRPINDVIEVVLVIDYETSHGSNHPFW